MTEIVIIKTDDIVSHSLSEKELYFEKLKDVLNLSDTQLYILKNYTYDKISIDKLDEINIKNLLSYKNFEVILITDLNSEFKVQFPDPVKYIHKKDLDYFLVKHDDNLIFTEGPTITLNIVGILLPNLGNSPKPSSKKIEEKEDSKSILENSKMGGFEIQLKSQILKRTAHIEYFYKKIFKEQIKSLIKDNLTFLSANNKDRYIIFKDKVHQSAIIKLLLELNFSISVCSFPLFIDYLLNICIKENTDYSAVNIFDDFREVISSIDEEIVESDLTKFVKKFQGAYVQKVNDPSLKADMAANKLTNEYYLLLLDEKAKIDKCEDILISFSLQEQARKLKEQYLEEIRQKLAFRSLFNKKYWSIFSNIFGYFSADIYRNLNFNTKSFISKEEQTLIDKFLKNIKVKEVKPWDKIIENIRLNKFKKKNLELLETYIRNKDTDDYLAENGDVVICAHLYKLFHGAESVLEYASDTVIENLYFCRNCGEEIGKKQFAPKISWEGDRELGQHHVDDEITQYTARFVSGAIKSEMNFRQQIPEGHLFKMTKKITTTLLPDVKSITKQLQLDKIATSDQKEEEKKLYTIIYIYALLAKLVFDNNKDIKFKFYGEYGQNYKLADLLDSIARIIVMRQNITINKIERIKAKDVRYFLGLAYDELSNRLVAHVKQLNVQSKEYKLNDPIVQYLSYRFKDQEQQLRILNSVDFSKSYAFYNVDFSIHLNKHSDGSNDSEEIFTKYLALDHNSTPLLPNGEHTGYYAEYLKLFLPFKSMEQAEIFEKSTFRKKKWLASKIIHQRRFVPLKTDIDDFLKDSHVDQLLSLNYSFKDGFHKHIFKQGKCIKCGTPFGTITNEKLKDAVNKYKNIDNFYNFYFNQCLQPKDDKIFHTFEGNKCTQCGIEKVFIINRDIGFFEKYYNVFEKAHIKKILEFKKKDVEEYKKKETTKYVKDTTIYNTFLDKTMVKFLEGPSIAQEKSIIQKKNEYIDFWRYVGLYQLNEFRILNVNDKDITKNSLVRAQWLNYYIDFLIKKYVAFKNYKDIKILDPDFKKIMDNSNLTFPPINLKKYFNGYHLIKPFGLSLEDTESYYYEALLSLILEMNENVKNKDFLYYILNIVIKNEKSVSLPSEMERARITAEFQDAVVINETEEIAEDDVFKKMDYDGENEEGAT